MLYRFRLKTKVNETENTGQKQRDISNIKRELLSQSKKNKLFKNYIERVGNPEKKNQMAVTQNT